MNGDERRILWELPLERGWQYIHAIYYRDGLEVIEPMASIVEEIRTMKLGE
jgi:hypothetical protein